MSRIEDAVIAKIKARAELGKNKYNTTMERNDLNLHQWLQHLQEELLDASIYVQKLMEIQTEVLQESILDRYDEEELESRMDIIGQNGNDGLHYANVDGYFTSGSLNINGAEVTYRSPCSNHAYESDQEK